jgi:hypothetical protein
MRAFSSTKVAYIRRKSNIPNIENKRRVRERIRKEMPIKRKI